MIQLTEGLTFIHEKNIVLRNLCPENILILNNGNLVISHFADAIMLTEVKCFLYLCVETCRTKEFWLTSTAADAFEQMC